MAAPSSGSRVVLFLCGSFNPMTIMHLRMFELAKDYFHRIGKDRVIGGIMSPVHDAYGKKGLLHSKHRVEMTRTALCNHAWIKLSNWESTHQSGWTRTCEVVDYHQNRIDAYLNGEGATESKEKDEWMPDCLNPHETSQSPVQVRLLCGADVLESFNVPDLWSHEHMTRLTRDYGLVVISREGNDPQKSIYGCDILYQHQGNIHLVQEWIRNEISSTKIRLAIRRQESIKYFVPDGVIDYINKHKLYVPEPERDLKLEMSQKT